MYNQKERPGCGARGQGGSSLLYDYYRRGMDVDHGKVFFLHTNNASVQVVIALASPRLGNPNEPARIRDAFPSEATVGKNAPEPQWSSMSFDRLSRDARRKRIREGEDEPINDIEQQDYCLQI